MSDKNHYQPPFAITSKILNLVSEISAEITMLEILEPKIITPILRKNYKIRTITRTLEIEGNTLGIEEVTAILEGKRVLSSVREIAEVQGAIKVYNNLEKLELSHNPTFRKNYLNPALGYELVEMHNPESPRSFKQKYRLER